MGSGIGFLVFPQTTISHVFLSLSILSRPDLDILHLA